MFALVADAPLAAEAVIDLSAGLARGSQTAVEYEEELSSWSGAHFSLGEDFTISGPCRLGVALSYDHRTYDGGDNRLGTFPSADVFAVEPRLSIVAGTHEAVEHGPHFGIGAFDGRLTWTSGHAAYYGILFDVGYAVAVNLGDRFAVLIDASGIVLGSFGVKDFFGGQISASVGMRWRL